jgi:hypothetical protein
MRRRLIPSLTASVILPVANLSQIRIAPATGCLIRVPAATPASRRALCGDHDCGKRRATFGMTSCARSSIEWRQACGFSL